MVEAHENRTAIRLPASIPVKARFGATTHNLVTLDVSARGAFVVIAEPPEPGHLVHLSMLLPGVGATTLQGMVMRTVTGAEARERAVPAGMGILFYGLGQSARRAWEDFFHGLVEEHHRQGGVAFPPTPARVQGAGEEPVEEPSDAFDFEGEPPTLKKVDLDEPTVKFEPVKQREEASAHAAVSLSPTGPIQAPLQWSQPVLYRVCPPSLEGLRQFRDEALGSGGITIRGAARRAQGSPAVVAVVHPDSRAEFHIPGTVEAAPPDADFVPVRFISVTRRTRRDYDAFIDDLFRSGPTTQPRAGSGEREMVLFERAEEAQTDIVLDDGGAVQVDGVLPLEEAINPFGRKR